ncbi:MAG: hypothetical protein AB7F28_08795 [Candidatus Margulisiibacteriota bacterium]
MSLFKASRPDARVIVALTPCQYASGQEKARAQAIEGVSEVFSPKETFKLLLSSKKWGTDGAVLYLGGDPFYSQLFGLKWGYPVFGYTEHQRSLGMGFKQTFFKQKIGDLMAARVALKAIQKGPERHQHILFFCGSRPPHFEAFLPFIGEVIQQLNHRRPELKTTVMVSPFISETQLNRLQFEHQLGHVSFSRGDSLATMAESDLLVSLPGTNTAEAMYMHLPMLILVPTNRVDLIILDGLAGLVGKIPGLGLLVKKIIVWFLAKQKRFYALPNRIANEALVPEMVGQVTVDGVTDAVLRTLEPEPWQAQRQALMRFKPTVDTAQYIVSQINAG